MKIIIITYLIISIIATLTASVTTEQKVTKLIGEKGVIALYIIFFVPFILTALWVHNWDCKHNQQTSK